MKAIHYDAEGDILSVTFFDVGEQKHTGVQLSDNIVLYYNPETEQPLELILSGYQAMMRVTGQTPIRLDGLAQMPAGPRATVLNLLTHPPLSGFLQVVEGPAREAPTSRLHAVFAPDVLATGMAT